MSEEQKMLFFEILQEAYEKGKSSERATAESFVEELKEKLNPVVKGTFRK